MFVAKWAEHISLGLPLDFTQDEIVTFRYSLILDIVRNSLSLDVHVKNSEKHEKNLPSSTKPNGKHATKRKHQCSGKSTSNKATTAMKTIGKALNGSLSDNQGASCKSSAGPEKVPNKTLFKDHASTDYATTVSGKDPNITLLDTHHSICKTGSGSENASNKILLDIMDNQESRDNNNPNPNPDNPNQGTTCNPRFLLTKASRKTMLDDQETQANTTYGAGKPEPKILTDNHCLIIDNATSVSGKAPNNTSSGTQASNASQNSTPVQSVTSSKGNILSEKKNPSTLSNSQSTSINEDHCYSCTVPPKKKKSSTTDLPTKVATILPTEYEYKCIEFEDLSVLEGSFRVQFCIKNVTCKDDVDIWLSKLATSSNIKYNMESGGRSRTGKRVSFARWYICQCKRKKLTKKQESAKKKVQDKKHLQRQAHPKNTVPEQLDLLSKTRDKKTDCDSKLSIKIFTKRPWNEMCEV